MKIDIDLTTKILGAIGGLYVVVKETAKAVTTYLKWKGNRSAHKSNFFRGNWNNQGQLRNVPSHYIDMDSFASGRRFRGQFNVRLGNDADSWRMFALTGKRQLGKMKCKIWDGESEESKIVAEGVLKISRGNMVWVLKEGSLAQFPEKAILRRGLPKIA